MWAKSTQALYKFRNSLLQQGNQNKDTRGKESFHEEEIIHNKQTVNWVLQFFPVRIGNMDTRTKGKKIPRFDLKCFAQDRLKKIKCTDKETNEEALGERRSISREEVGSNPSKKRNFLQEGKHRYEKYYRIWKKKDSLYRPFLWTVYALLKAERLIC